MNNVNYIGNHFIEGKGMNFAFWSTVICTIIPLNNLNAFFHWCINEKLALNTKYAHLRKKTKLVHLSKRL